MHSRLCQANGTSTAGQELVEVMRTFTTLDGKDDTYHPFRPTVNFFESSVPATININGEGEVDLREDPTTGTYVITLEQGMVTTKTMTISEVADWKCTFLF